MPRRPIVTPVGTAYEGPVDLDDTAVEIQPSPLARVLTLRPKTADGLPAVTLPEPDDATRPSLHLGDVVARGGFGVVREATQRGLDRRVAVKQVRDDEHAEEAAAMILREARVVGALEHPNIVPVYALGHDERGQPLIVMKHIDGDTWSDRLREGACGDPGYLDEHLGVLVQVAGAIGCAHARGVLHRDVKPDNVMIGRFGEVYVVDWGAAAATRDDTGIPDLRPVGERPDVVGTPAYMAPEAASADTARVGAHTDVYNLGATLHEILTGRPPHSGESVMQILAKAYVSRPYPYAPSVPTELAEIARRAMAFDSAQRYPDGRAFAEQIRAYLRNRSSVLLAADTGECLEGLRALVRADPDTRDDREVLAAFAECRFGFGEALRLWPDNPVALAGLETARQLEAELRRTAPELRVRTIEQALDVPDEPVDGLWLVLAAAVAVAVGVLCGVMGVIDRNVAGGLGYLVPALVCTSVAVGVGLAAHRSERFAVAGVVWLVLLAPTWPLAWLVGVPLGAAAVAWQLGLAAAGAVAAATAGRTYALFAVASAIGCVVTAALPAWGFEIMGASTLVGVAATVVSLLRR